MASSQIERRLSSLEAEVAGLKQKVSKGASAVHWAQEIYGIFRNDPAFREAARLGRAYRASLKPARNSKGKLRNGRAGHRSH